MDKQTTVQGEGSKTGRKAKGQQAEAETPVVGSEGTEVTEPVDATPKRPVDVQYKEALAALASAQAAMTNLANRVHAAGQTEIIVDGKPLQVRKGRDGDDYYFYDPSTAKPKAKPKAKKGPADAATLLV